MKKAYLIILVVVYFQILYLASASINRNFFYNLAAKSYICLSCPPGTYVENDCTIPKTTGRCKICPMGYFQPSFTSSKSCISCVTECIYMEETADPFPAVCDSTSNFCMCKNKSCILNSKCPPGTEPAIQATSSQHTTCRICPDETYSNVSSRTEMCKPMSKCGPHEVAILNGKKTQDRVCILRNETDMYITNFTTTPHFSYITTTVLNITSYPDKNLDAGKSLLYLLTMIFTFILPFTLLFVVLVVYKRKYLLKKIRLLKGDKEYGTSCDSGISEDIAENTEETSCHTEKDNRTRTRRISDVSMHPLLGRVVTNNNDSNRQSQPLPGSDPVNKNDIKGHLEQSDSGLIQGEVLVHKTNPREDSISKPTVIPPSALSFEEETSTTRAKHNAAVNNNANEGQLKPLPCGDSVTNNDSEGYLKQSRVGSQQGEVLVPEADLGDFPLLQSFMPHLSSTFEKETTATPATHNQNKGTPTFTNYTQFEKTKTLQCSHLPTQKTIFSTDWQWSEHITNEGCTIQLPNSDVTTTFPPGVLSDCCSSAYCHKSVHNDIQRLAAELCLPCDSVITSPSPEYHMEATFAEFVQVDIPHRMPKYYKQIEVQSFSKCAGSKVKLFEVPVFYDRSEADDKLDMFCVINSESVVIYTKHFSGFVCTTCQKYIEYNLTASIYGRKGLIDSCVDTLDVLLYLKGAKSTIADFETTVEHKIDRRFHHLETTRVKLLEQHQQREGGQLQFRFGLVSNSLQTWTHRKAGNDEQFTETLVLANPEDLMLECEKHLICSPGTKWYLQRRDRSNTNCDFYVEIVHKEKPPSAQSALRHIKTYIPACEDFSIPGAPSVASESVGQNTATIPGAITDVVMTLNEHLTQQDKLKLVKHMGCLRQLPPTTDRRQRYDFRYDYWYTAFIECYYHLKDQFINRVLEGLERMRHEHLAQLVHIHAPQNNSRIAFIPPHQHPTHQQDGRHTPQITQPSSASASASESEDSNKDG